MSPRALWRLHTRVGVRLARGTVQGGPAELLPPHLTIDRLLADPKDGLKAALTDRADGPLPPGSVMLAPVDGQEIWAAGVTFQRSRTARKEESGGQGDFYDRVYHAERPELFLKAVPGKARGPGMPIGIRSDSAWNVPEPELAVVADTDGRIVAYTIGNDVSSRSIEGENPLYLPQAKVYRGSCALGPCLVPAEEAPPLEELEIALTISRHDATFYHDAVPVSAMRRRPEELVDWLFRAQDFQCGVVLLCGTSIVPGSDFTLQAGDRVSITITGLGELVNPVEVVSASRGRQEAVNR
jgi:2-dehydro-3-deoxy-D-arabinonate dehydratase